MLPKLFFVSACSLLVFSDLSAQPCMGSIPGQDFFSCTGYYIVEDTNNRILTNCEDRLTLCLGTPMPPKHERSPVESPIRVLARVFDDNGDYKLTEVKGAFSFDASKGFLTFIPDSFPVSTDGDINPITYQVIMDCRYFYGPDNEETSTRYLTKQNIVRACAQARSMTDSSDLSSAVQLTPALGVCVQYLRNGLELKAKWNIDRWKFDHWESSIPLAGLDRYELAQLLDNECWPVLDTVIFTAWYTDLTLGIRENQSVENRITIAYQNGDIIVHDPDTDIYRWMLSDVQGRIFSQTDGCFTEPCTIPTGGTTGMAILIGVGLTHSYSTSLFLH